VFVEQMINSLIGVSPAIQSVKTEIERAARCDAKVLLLGESGVGKDIAARLIHQKSARAHVPLVSINCAGIPESLLESELFGHMRGSFTGAFRSRAGLLEMAHRGTVFLDEVGETGARMQALLLRFLETGELQRVGADRAQVRVDVRVIAATNRDLSSDIASGRFREDLYYRMNVIDIMIPPLRARREDIPLLFDFYLRRFSEHHHVPAPAIAARAMGALIDYDWPGNVRQLKNAVERLVIRRGGASIDLDDLPAIFKDGWSAPVAAETTLPASGPVSIVSRGDGPDRAARDALFERMVRHRESFWSTVYSPYMSRDITRADLRALIVRGLQETAGNYKMLVELFNMQPSDYKRFLNFLRKQECQVPFAAFRAVEPKHRRTTDEGFARVRPNSEVRH
jgi:DNA-binding NtrC family response regulator